MVLAAGTVAAVVRLRRRYLQGVSGAVSGPRTNFDHKQLYRRFVLGSTTLQPSYPYPTYLPPSPLEPRSCRSYIRKNLIFKVFHNQGNSHTTSVQLFAQQQVAGAVVLVVVELNYSNIPMILVGIFPIKLHKLQTFLGGKEVSLTIT